MESTVNQYDNYEYFAFVSKEFYSTLGRLHGHYEWFDTEAERSQWLAEHREYYVYETGMQPNAKGRAQISEALRSVPPVPNARDYDKCTDTAILGVR